MGRLLYFESFIVHAFFFVVFTLGLTTTPERRFESTKAPALLLFVEMLMLDLPVVIRVMGAFCVIAPLVLIVVQKVPLLD